MRKLRAKGFVLELLSILALIFSVALAWIGSLKGVNIPTEANISAAVGIAVAAYIWALKWEIKRDIDEKITLYSLLEKIEDEELHSRGKEAIEKCRIELENLSKGILQLDVGELYKYLIQVIKKSKNRVQVTQIIPDQATFDRLPTFLEKPWYKQNVEVAQKVKFERLFIVPREIALESPEKLQSDFRDLLERQQKDNIDVMVVWLDDLEAPDLVQDFAIIDKNIVVVTSPSWLGGYNNVLVYRKKYDIDRYLSIFDSIVSKARKLTDFAVNRSPTQHQADGARAPRG